MATRPRLQSVGSFYHVYNRGNRKGELFLEDRDYARFRDRLTLYKDRCGFSLLCYSLMPNHFHLLLRQLAEVSLTEFMHYLGTSYARFFNTKYDLVGSPFQGRFKSIVVESEGYLLHLSRYIHLNAVDLGYDGESRPLAGHPWSSYAEYIGQNGICDGKEVVLNYFNDNVPNLSYQDFVQSMVAEYQAKGDEEILPSP